MSEPHASPETPGGAADLAEVAAGRAALDCDLLCLQCGYNLRGLGGDPITCPECATPNSIEAAVFPAGMIECRLRNCETPAAVAALSLLTALFFQGLLWWSVAISHGAASDPWPPGLHFFDCCLTLPAFGLLPIWVLAVSWFLARRRGTSGSAWLLVRYHAILGGAVLSVIAVVLVPSLGQPDRAPWNWLHTFLAVPLEIVAIALVFWWLVLKPYYRLRNELHHAARAAVIAALRCEARERVRRARSKQN